MISRAGKRVPIVRWISNSKQQRCCFYRVSVSVWRRRQTCRGRTSWPSERRQRRPFRRRTSGSCLAGARPTASCWRQAPRDRWSNQSQPEEKTHTVKFRIYVWRFFARVCFCFFQSNVLTEQNKSTKRALTKESRKRFFYTMLVWQSSVNGVARLSAILPFEQKLFGAFFLKKSQILRLHFGRFLDGSKGVKVIFFQNTKMEKNPVFQGKRRQQNHFPTFSDHGEIFLAHWKLL